MPFAVGILVNPVAGMGGSVGLKGSDGAETLRCARERGAVPHAAEKMARALAAALPDADARFLTAGGPMGEEVLAACGLPYKAVYSPAGETTGEDTVRAVRAMRDSGAELIVFAGGDGTARDVCAALGDEEMPVLGVPAGVKIHSAVFAVTPERAGQLLSRIVSGEARETAEAEVMDIDEDAFRAGHVSARLYGYLRVPLDRTRMQNRKSGGSSSDARDISAIGTWLAHEMKPGRLYLIGAGTTTRAVMEALGLRGTLLGVDAVKDGRLIAADCTERDLLRLIEPGNTSAVLSVIGGQGHILGRGSQQFSPAVLRALGPKNLIVAAAPAKLDALFPSPLRVDTGDPQLDAELCGYIPVVTGWAASRMARVER